jgi:hypothetical protein
MKKISIFIVIFFVIALSGCGRNVRPEFSRHKILYCGWLDLREDKYKQVGYNTRGEWSIIIKRINTYFLQQSITDRCKSFRVIGATGKAENPPPNSYHLKFTLVDFDYAGAAMTVNIKVIDNANKRVIANFTSYASGVKNLASVVFMARMSQMCQDTAQDIAYNLYEK